MSDELDASAEVQAAPEQRRYEIRVGDETAGFTQFVDRDDQRIFFHTEIDERFSGRGLATTLIRAALTDSVADDRRIVPVCEFVATFVGKHDEFADDVDPVTPEAEHAAAEADH